MNAEELLVITAEKALENENSFIVAGNNGPYNDPEKLIRTLGHWLLIFARVYGITGQEKFINKVEILAHKMLEPQYRPYKKSFYHRDKAGKDQCNGLIGQAWTFESLAMASTLLNDDKYLEVGREVYFLHEFNRALGLWNRLEIDGAVLSIDDTFNHQLWFAACSLLLVKSKDDSILNDVLRFMECLPNNLTILDNGLIYHPIECEIPKDIPVKEGFKESLKKILRPIYIKILSKKKQPADVVRRMMVIKSIGYHSFNLHAFAMMKQALPEHKYWDTDDMQKMVSYLSTEEYIKGVDGNKYSYAYNAPGFEVPYALSVFMPETASDIYSFWLNKQMQFTYNPNTGMFDRNNEDSATLTSRLYELSRKEDLNFNINIGE